MQQTLSFRYGVIGQWLGGAGLGGTRQDKRFLISISECTEEQRHTEPEWVALSGCEAPHLGTAVQVQGQQPRVAMVTEGLHLK